MQKSHKQKSMEHNFVEHASTALVPRGHHHHRRRCRRRHKNTTKNNIITTSKTPPKHDYHHQSTTKGKTLLSPQKHHYKNTTKTAPVTVTNAFDVLLDILFFSPDGNASFSLFLSPDDGDYYGRGGSN